MPTGMTGLGWVASSDPTTIGVFKVEPLAGWPVYLRASTSPVQQYLIRELNKIEANDQAIYGWEYRANVNDPTNLSEHGAGTAFDYRARKHPNGVRGTWGKNEIVVDRLLARIALAAGTPVFRWGEHYRTIPDGMHFEVISQQAANSAIAGLQLDIDGYRKVPTPDHEEELDMFIATAPDGRVWLIKGDTKEYVPSPALKQEIIDTGIPDKGRKSSQFIDMWVSAD